MKYESSIQMAERLGVTARTVQKRAAQGKIPGAVKVGRDWKIPVLMERKDKVRIPMPLLNSSFPVGQCKEYLLQILDEDEREIALGEYYYFSGQAKKAAMTVEAYLKNENVELRFSAAFIYAFANLTLDRIASTTLAIRIIQKDLQQELKEKVEPQRQAVGVFMATAAKVLLHLPLEEIPPLEEYLKYIPGGLKVFACYVLAHKAYLMGNYERSLAIADMALVMSEEHYPIAEIYIHNVATMALMNLMRIDEAKARFAKAWEYAKGDHLIQAFGEHHGLLQGMVEVYFKKKEPQIFAEITEIVYHFSAGWRKIRKEQVDDEVADNLSTLEFTIAMLYSRKWTIKEIAYYMEISERTVKNHLATIYEKLGVKGKQQLRHYMLK